MEKGVEHLRLEALERANIELGYALALVIENIAETKPEIAKNIIARLIFRMERHAENRAIAAHETIYSILCYLKNEASPESRAALGARWHDWLK